MDPNIVTNTGTDIGVWISAAVAWVLCAIALFITLRLFSKWKKLAEGEELLKVFVSALITVGLFATSLWFVFGAYGAGEPVNLPPPSADGFQQIVQEAPDEISDKEKEKLGEEKLPDVLKEVRRKAAQDGGTEDDYIKKAIERANKMQGGNK